MLQRAKEHKVDGFTKVENGDWTEPYVFIHGADPQLGFISKIKGEKGLTWDEEVHLLNEGISAINKMTPPPRFLFICGDLVDAEPDKEDLNKAQTKDLLQVLFRCHIPVFVACGNHDVGNKTTKEFMEYYRKQFGDDYYSFYVGGVFYIVLNSQYFMDSSEVNDLAEEQMAWLNSELEVAKNDQSLQHVVIFMHIPLFISEADEKDQYFNIPTTLRMTLLHKFGLAGVEAVFSGHYHRNGGGVWKTKINGKDIKIEMIVTSAIGAQLGKDKSGMAVVKVDEVKLTQQYCAMEDLPEHLII